MIGTHPLSPVGRRRLDRVPGDPLRGRGCGQGHVRLGCGQLGETRVGRCHPPAAAPDPGRLAGESNRGSTQITVDIGRQAGKQAGNSGSQRSGM